MKKKIGIVSLGCAKNLVDSEMMLASFPKDAFEITIDPNEADVLIVNTCGFIGDAKEESIEALLEMSKHKQAKIIATGCFVERNYEELKEAMPEVDLFIPIKEYKNFHAYVSALLNGEKIDPLHPLKRFLCTKPYFAYLRISDGCDNYCAFCAIPLIRGPLRSRRLGEIIDEAYMLKERGVKEIALISQDPLNYGKDIGDGNEIVELLEAIESVGFYAVRILYLHPDEIDLKFIDFMMNKAKTILPYFDIPVQSGSRKVLKLMNRGDDLYKLSHNIKVLKSVLPHAAFRTTFITGFPGERINDHMESLNFLASLPFDHVGAFTFSREEGTAAYNMPHQVRHSTALKRKDQLMDVARQKCFEYNHEHIGEVMEGIVIGYDKKTRKYRLRSYWNGPDDIDGNIYFTSPFHLEEGDIVNVKITKALTYDLIGKFVIDKK